MHRKCQPMRWKQELSCHEATVLTTWRYRSVLSLKIDFSRWMIPSKVSSVWNVFRLASVSRYCGCQHKTSNMKGWVCFSFLWFYFKKKTTEITETFPMCEKLHAVSWPVQWGPAPGSADTPSKAAKADAVRQVRLHYNGTCNLLQPCF